MQGETSLTSDSLSNGLLFAIHPELNDLATVIENSDVHDHQSVLAHTKKTHTELNRIVGGESWLPSENQPALRRLLAMQIGSLSRNGLLFIATDLHDIGKLDVPGATSGDEATSNIGHEQYGLETVGRICDSLRLNTAQSDRVAAIIQHHQDIHTTLANCLAGADETEEFNQLKAKGDAAGGIYLELLLLGLADIRGSDLARLHPDRFQRQEALIQKHISGYLDNTREPSTG